MFYFMWLKCWKNVDRTVSIWEGKSFVMWSYDSVQWLGGIDLGVEFVVYAMMLLCLRHISPIQCSF